MGERIELLVKSIVYFGKPAAVVCDGRCEKAWGINNRPRVQLSADEDDYAFLADHELGTAPSDPGTYEGGCAKPRDYTDPARQNKWCVRECERSELGESGRLTLRTFAGRVYNRTPVAAPPAGGG